ncbi:hypothetical protein HX024_17855 [Myroides marinus]|uniref:hypothetical protein n=1 Tax=Myroides marinus TaxID=703342 RepID=UPI0025774DC4|nr:hypothetical protein [Myroides marinus]MDM1384527.1 hypothetical protein [Myroides marinus]
MKEKKEIIIRKKNISDSLLFLLKGLGIPYLILLIYVHFGEVDKAANYMYRGNLYVKIPFTEIKYYSDFSTSSDIDSIHYIVILYNVYIPSVFGSMLNIYLILCVLIFIVLLLIRKFKLVVI